MRKRFLATWLLLATVICQPLITDPPQASAQGLAGPPRAAAEPTAHARPDRVGSPLLPRTTATPIWPDLPIDPGAAPVLPGHTGKSARPMAAYGQLPLDFEINRGQTDKRVAFLARGGGYILYLTSSEMVLSLMEPAHTTRAAGRVRGRHVMSPFLENPRLAPPMPMRESVLRLQFVGANPHLQITGLDELPGRVNYFIGNNPKRWHANIPTYARVGYQDVYPNIDLAFYGRAGQVEYDWIVRPGGDPSQIRLGIMGAQGMRLDPQGNLVLPGAGGVVLRQARPVVYQVTHGMWRHPITGRYVL